MLSPDDKTDDHAEKFVKLFVFLFEESLLTYHRTLVDKTPKLGKWADLAGCVIRIVTTGTLLSATGATVGSPVGVTVGCTYNFLIGFTVTFFRSL